MDDESVCVLQCQAVREDDCVCVSDWHMWRGCALGEYVWKRWVIMWCGSGVWGVGDMPLPGGGNELGLETLAGFHLGCSAVAAEGYPSCPLKIEGCRGLIAREAAARNVFFLGARGRGFRWGTGAGVWANL